MEGNVGNIVVMGGNVGVGIKKSNFYRKSVYKKNLGLRIILGGVILFFIKS